MAAGPLMSVSIPCTPGLKFVQASGTTTTLKQGQVVIPDVTLSTSTDTISNIVTRPTLGNLIRGVGYIVHPQNDGATSTNNITGIPLTERGLSNIPVWTDQNVTAGDLLGPQPETHNWRRGVFFTPYAARALESQDRSTTAGTVLCDIVPHVPYSQLVQQHYDYINDFHTATTLHNGLTAQANAPTISTVDSACLGGIVGCVTGATTNTVGGFRTTSQVVTLAAGNALWMEGRIATAVGTALAGSVFFGCSGVAGSTTTMFADTSHALAASQSFFGVARILGTAWAPVVGAAGTNVTSTVTQANADGTTGTVGTGFSTGTPMRWGFFFNGGSLSASGTGRILVYYNNTLLCTLGSGSPSGAPTDIPTVKMYAHLCTKNVGSVETTCDIDYMRIRQMRTAGTFAA